MVFIDRAVRWYSANKIIALTKEKYKKKMHKYINKKRLRIYTGNEIIKRNGEILGKPFELKVVNDCCNGRLKFRVEINTKSLFILCNDCEIQYHNREMMPKVLIAFEKNMESAGLQYWAR